MTQAIVFMALVPVSLLLVFGLVFVSGRLSVGRRRQVELVLLCGALAVLAGMWVWQSYLLVQLNRPVLFVIGYAAIEVMVCVGMLGAIRKRRRGGTLG